jgi:hypothetical protein
MPHPPPIASSASAAVGLSRTSNGVGEIVHRSSKRSELLVRGLPRADEAQWNPGRAQEMFIGTVEELAQEPAAGEYAGSESPTTRRIEPSRC